MSGADISSFGGGQARDIDPSRFGDLPPGYVTLANASSRAGAYYGPPGTYDPAALAFDEAHKDTVALGEFITQTALMVAAPQFAGDVLTVNGGDDLFFCSQPGCANTGTEARFYPAANSVEWGELRNGLHPATSSDHT